MHAAGTSHRVPRQHTPSADPSPRRHEHAPNVPPRETLSKPRCVTSSASMAKEPTGRFRMRTSPWRTCGAAAGVLSCSWSMTQHTSVRTAVAVIGHLPPHGSRLDQRQLASDHAHNPHALDEGTTLAGLVLALTTAAGVTSTAQRTRDAWDRLGVDCDDLTGGLITVGIHPAGWYLPPHAVVTLPPRELASCEWPAAPRQDDTVFITENPSVATAAADLAGSGVNARLLCTSGTPSAREVGAIARLAAAGWHVRVRADFDVAGLTHVETLLGNVPCSAPWRMGVIDYEASVPRMQQVALDPECVPATPWEPGLAATMRSTGSAAFEEALMPQLLDDLRAAADRG
jgi:uncharacterized protein (TIGR02679 family)